MSRERELLERVLKHFDETFRPLDKAILTDSIRDFLSTPETTQDEAPVGTLGHNGNFKLLRMVGIPISQPMKLYEHPAPRPEFVRLSEEEVTEILTSAYDMYAAICAVENRLVEKNQ